METPVAIYRIVNSINGKSYIGQTVNPKYRMRRHFWKNNGCIKLRNAIAKYGKNNFVFSILCWCVSKTEANKVEEQLINVYNTRFDGYNITPGGYGTGSGADNPFFGRKHSDELKAKWSAMKKGKIVLEETRKKLAEANRKRTMSEETKNKLRARPKSILCSIKTAEANKKRVWTEEAKAKLAAFNLGKKMSNETKAKIAAANKARVWSDASRAKLAASKTKRKVENELHPTV